MGQQLSVINTAVVFPSTTNDYLNCEMWVWKKKEEQKWLWILLMSLWWCSEVRLEYRSSECFSEKTWTEIILNLLLQTPLHPSLSVITTCSLISLQALRTKIAKAIFFFFLLTWFWHFQLWNIINAVFSFPFFYSLSYLLQRPTQFSYSLFNPLWHDSRCPYSSAGASQSFLTA